MSEFHNASAIGRESQLWDGEGLMDLTEQEVEALASGRESVTEPTSRTMSDRPTLWVHPVCDCKGRNGSHLTVCASLNTRSASGADLLAALDVEWYCMYGHDEDCVSDPHDGCHWAVKP